MGDSGAGGGSTGLGDGSGSGLGSGENGIINEIQEIDPLFEGSYLATAIGVLAVVGALVGVVGLILGLLNWDREQFRQVLLAYGGKALGLLLVGLFIWLLFDQFSLSIGGGSTGVGGDGDSEGAGAVSDATGMELPAILGIAVVAAVIIGALVLVQRSGGDEEEAPPAAPDAAEADGPPTPAVEDVSATPGASAVGRAAADNEVYRAWLALADAAGANARRDTPDEVVDRAVDSGVEADAATEITSLFERVRYGDTEPDEQLERRARRARERLAEGR